MTTQQEAITIRPVALQLPLGDWTTVSAEIHGPFAIHETLTHKVPQAPFSLSHIPSGRAIDFDLTILEARAESDLLLSFTGIDWQHGDPFTINRQLQGAYHKILQDLIRARRS